MILSPQAAIAALRSTSGLISIIDGQHAVIVRISPADAVQRCILSEYQVCERKGKIKWMREIQVVVAAPHWLPGHLTEWGAVINPTVG